jgi:OHCU decarboxylase
VVKILVKNEHDAMAQTSPESPSAMTEEHFIERFGAVYEHSPWIARAAWRQGLGPEQDTSAGLSTVMATIVDQSSTGKQLALINAHPDLAGKAALQGRLTEVSSSEQAGAGIDQCNAEELERFLRYNDAYKRKFRFPFIMAVKGSNRHAILAAFETRLQNDAETEFRRALTEIHKIARWRLGALVGE